MFILKFCCADNLQVYFLLLFQSSEVPKPKKSPEINDVNVSCLASNGSGTKETMPTSNGMDRANVLSAAASSKVRREALEINKVALSQENTTSGNISASLPKTLTHSSLSEDSKNISKESATSFAAENTQDNVVAKDLLRDVSKMHDSSEGTSESVTNDDRFDKLKLNGVSAASEDHVFATHETIVAAESLKEDSNRQEGFNEPATTTADINGPSDSSHDIVLHESLNTPKPDESTLPTADVSAFSYNCTRYVALGYTCVWMYVYPALFKG